MRTVFQAILMVAALAALMACGGSKFQTYDGPAVTLIEVHKADRKMYLLSGAQVLKVYPIKLGGNPIGDKEFEGDQKTPEGDRKSTRLNSSHQ